MSTFIEQLKERAKKDIKTIVLAEGEEIRTLKAAEMVKKEGYAKIILVGNPDKIKAMAAAENLDIDGIKIVDSENGEKNEEYAMFSFAESPESEKVNLSKPTQSGT